MTCFDDAQNEAINRMWINVRCYNIKKVPVWAWLITAIVLAGLVWLILERLGILKKLRKN
jgi:spermidine/putrescine transport system substrate-binding protein